MLPFILILLRIECFFLFSVFVFLSIASISFFLLSFILKFLYLLPFIYDSKYTLLNVKAMSFKYWIQSIINDYFCFYFNCKVHFNFSCLRDCHFTTLNRKECADAVRGLHMFWICQLSYGSAKTRFMGTKKKILS